MSMYTFEVSVFIITFLKLFLVTHPGKWNRYKVWKSLHLCRGQAKGEFTFVYSIDGLM